MLCNSRRWLKPVNNSDENIPVASWFAFYRVALMDKVTESASKPVTLPSNKTRPSLSKLITICQHYFLMIYLISTMEKPVNTDTVIILKLIFVNHD